MQGVQPGPGQGIPGLFVISREHDSRLSHDPHFPLSGVSADFLRGELPHAFYELIVSQGVAIGDD